MRVVLDSNVIVSAFLISSDPAARILDQVRQGWLIRVLSGYILNEVARVAAGGGVPPIPGDPGAPAPQPAPETW